MLGTMTGMITVRRCVQAVHLFLGVATLLAPPAMAQQPVQPLPKAGGCPLGYYASGGYCVPSRSGKPRGAIEKSG